MADEQVVFTLNCGSSSLKFAAYRFAPDSEERLVHGSAQRIGMEDGQLWARDRDGGLLLDERGHFATHERALRSLLNALRDNKMRRGDAVGHRVVHGGPHHMKPERVTPELMQSLKSCIPLAPLHLPPQIASMDFVFAVQPNLPQVACFDTTFHHAMPERARRLPLPRDMWDEGVRKYGFHGLSYEYIVSILKEDVAGAVIIAHLGNGASMAALRDGQPVDTTMGLTPTGGIMMGTRSGDLDPGVLVYLAKERGYDPMRLARLVENESGLLGVSGLSSDMQKLLKACGDVHAAQAVEMYCYRARKEIGALAAALGGLDLLVFTGGIGQNSAEIRSRICTGLEFLEVEIDEELNYGNAHHIGKAHSRCAIRVIPTDEDLMVARHTNRLIFGIE